MIDPIIDWLVRGVIEFYVAFGVAVVVIFALRYWYTKEGIIERFGDLFIVGTASFSFPPSLLFIILAIKKDMLRMIEVFQEFSPYIAVYSAAVLLITVDFLHAKWKKKPVKTGE